MNAAAERARLIEALHAAGLGHHVEALAPLVRTSIALQLRDALEHEVGASRIGGIPDLPVDVEWPRDREGPLPFIAQLDLAALAPLDLDHLLPPRGSLAFFGGWGQDAPRCAVLHLDGALAPRTAPEGIETERQQAIELVLRVELPPYSSHFVSIDSPAASHTVFDPRTGATAPLPRAAVPLPVGDHVRYADVVDRVAAERDGGHGLLGYDAPGDGVLCANDVILLRLDSDAHSTPEATTLYVLIDRTALARGDLGAACLWYAS